MFSGIVEAKANLLRFTPDLQNPKHGATIFIEKPSSFNDIGLGDSIAVNGICLTVEAISATELQFSLGPETLAITGWGPQGLFNCSLNLERSLKANERIHGHQVTGHVDGVGRVSKREPQGSSLLLDVELPREADWSRLTWKKGSICLNGVSLTVNEVHGSTVSVCLIPETCLRTNLSQLQVGDRVNVEVDSVARGLAHIVENYMSRFSTHNLKTVDTDELHS